MKFDKGVDKKRFKAPYHDGVQYNWRTWFILVARVAALEIGDPIYNYYKKRWETVKEIELSWHKPWKRNKDNPETIEESDAECVYDLNVISSSGYMLCDEMMFGPEEILEEEGINKLIDSLKAALKDGYTVMVSHL